MKKRTFAALLPFCLVACVETTKGTTTSLPTQSASAAPPNVTHPVTILVSVDGLLPASYIEPDAHGLRVPTLRKLKAQGAWAPEVMSVFPTLTYPAHTTIATGTPPSRHGVVTNRVMDPEEKDAESWRFFAPQIQAPSVFEAANANGIATALVHWPVSLGAKVTWNAPEFWSSRTANNAELLRAVSTPGLLDRTAAGAPEFWQRFTPPAVKDSALTDIAVQTIREGAQLVGLHLVEVDGEQHHWGLWSKEAIAAIENADHQLARLMNSASSARILLVSDHGFANTSTLVRPGVLLREQGLIALGERDRVTSWEATVVATGGNAYVYLRDENNPITKQRVREVFSDALRTRGAVSAIYTHEEIVKRGGDPKAFLALEAAANFQFEGSALGDYVRKGGYLATHGYAPERLDMQASFIAWGFRGEKGRRDGVRLLDIAPTLAVELGLPFPSGQGRSVLQ
jgi:predicted AlkP superfamily pyrophosphatase or phosphodiesterase